MPIIESQLDGRIATLLGNLDRRWTTRGENTGAFEGTTATPDILVTQGGALPLVIENEYLPAYTVESEAAGRLGARLNFSVVGASGQVNSVIALRSPTSLRDCNTLNQVDRLLRGGIQLEYALLTGDDGDSYERFPDAGFISGNLRDLAAFVEQAAIPLNVIEQGADILEQGVQRAAGYLHEAAELRDDTKLAFEQRLKQDYSVQTVRMAAAIMVNALVYQQNLAGQHGIRSLSQLQSGNAPITQNDVLAEWRKILQVNYWSIFHLASQLLENINPPEQARLALVEMVDTASRLASLGAGQSGDIVGIVFQRLIADRKFLATFYTKPESATLLAHLAIPDHGPWGDAERVRDFRMADYACGTGTLLHMAYRRVNRLHRLDGGDPAQLHGYMMANSLTACDVLPSAVHLTASMLSSSHPLQGYDSTRTVVTEYGQTGDGGVSVGSLDLLNGRTAIRALIPINRGTAVTGTGEVPAEMNVAMPVASQDLVIMNPPFTRPGADWEGDARSSDYVRQFRGLSNDLDTQRKMSEFARRCAQGTCAHGYAGLASYFVALADKMVKSDGTIALVLPLTVMQGTSWSKVRDLIRQEYGDVMVVSIATARSVDQSFSADTGMAEILLIARKSADARRDRGLFVSLRQRPRNEMEASEIARAITALLENTDFRALEDGPYGCNPIVIGASEIGEILDAPLEDGPWSVIGISDCAVAQTAFQLAQGRIWLPVMNDDDSVSIPTAVMGQICRVGFHDANIVGNGRQAAFTLSEYSVSSSFPILWGHDANRERSLIVVPDKHGRVQRGKEERASVIWDTRSHTHHNRNFRFNSQPLGVAFTERQSIGGSAWPNVQFESRAHEIAYTLWGNTTLGLLAYWWHSSRQQAGRGIMPITAIRAMPTLDVTQLTTEQLAIAEAIFDDLRDAEFLPANEAYRDDSRQELDRRVLIDLLGLPESILQPLALLRLKWCSEPSVHGGKSTRP